MNRSKREHILEVCPFLGTIISVFSTLISSSVHYFSQEDGAIMRVWGMYGREPNYITEWRLYSQENFGQEADPNIEKQWLLIESGGFPNAEVTVIRRDLFASTIFWPPP
jgi:hypothetical protein